MGSGGDAQFYILAAAAFGGVGLELSLLLPSALDLLGTFLLCKSSSRTADITLTCSVFVAQSTSEGKAVQSPPQTCTVFYL